MVDAMCACKTPACADGVKSQLAGADKPGDTSPSATALRDYMRVCEQTAREVDEVEMLRNMDAAMCACHDAPCTERVGQDYKDFWKREIDRYSGDRKPSPQVVKIAEHEQQCEERAREGSGQTAGNGTGLDHTGGNWHPAPPSGGSGGAHDTGVAACNEELTAFDRYMQCDKLPHEAKDAMRQSIEAQFQAIGDLTTASEETKRGAADSCMQVLDALQQSAAAMGCPL
jgi:hypothetical protein